VPTGAGADVHTLQQQLADATRRAEILQRVIESIGSGLSLEPLLVRILDSAVELIGAGYGTIGLVVERPDGPSVRTAAVHNMPPGELGAEMPAGIGLAGRVLLEQRAVRFDRYGDLDRPTLPELADHAVVGIPVKWAERIIGFLGIGAAAPRRFDERDVETLTLFAQHIALAIQNASLFEAEQRRLARMTIVNRIGRLINSSLSPDQILQTAAEAISEYLPYPNVALLLIDPGDPQTLVLRARSGIYTGNRVGAYRQSIEQGIIGAAARARRRILIEDVRSDPRYIPVPGVSEIRSELALPIIAGEQLLGVLNIESGQRIAEEDATGLEIVADELAVAIDHARRYEEEKRRTERLGLIARVGQRIALRLDPGELFDATVEELHGRLGYDHVSLFLLDPAEPTYLVQRARASRWPRGEATGYRQSIEQGIIGAAARQRLPERVNEVAADPRYVAVPAADGLRSELAVPILLGERLLGVLDLAGVRPFRAEDVAAAQIVADQLAVAIDNAQLFAQTQQALDETKLLYETSQRISVSMDIDDVIEVYLEQVAARGHYACSVVLYEFDEAGARAAVLLRGQWTPQTGLVRPETRLPHSYDALDPPLDAGQTIAIADVHTDPRASPELREIQTRDSRPALAMIPLMARDRRIGLVILGSPFVHQWSDADLRPYQATAAQLATAIDGRRQQLLLAEQGRQVAVLEERQRLSRELHDSVTQLIFSTTLIAQSIASAWRRDPAEGERRVNRLLELSQAALAEMRALLFDLRPSSAGLSKSAASGGRPVPGLVRVQRDGLAAALQQHAADLARDGLQVEVEAHGYSTDGARLPLTYEEAIFRIVQEALNNVVKHARAGQARVRLSATAGALQVSVKDDGLGFAPEQAANGSVEQRSGLGLKSMRERAEALGGTLSVTSTPGRGTTVEVILPRAANTPPQGK